MWDIKKAVQDDEICEPRVVDAKSLGNGTVKKPARF